MLWKIYYDDFSTFSDADGDVRDAPRLGVQFVVTRLEHNQKYLILSAADFYIWEKDIGWWYCNEAGRIDHEIRAREPLVLFGRMISWESHDKIAKRVFEELPGKKDSWRIWPRQQSPGAAEIAGEPDG